MFKYRFVCYDENNVRSYINDAMSNDFSYVKGVWGNYLYCRGLHFLENSTTIKGFFINESEWETVRGSPARIIFKGKFVKINDEIYFDVYIYPQIIEFLFFLFAITFFIITGGAMGMIVSIVVSCFVLKWEYDMIKETACLIERICKM